MIYMSTVMEVISLKLHKVQQNNTPYVITLYYPAMPSSVSFEGLEMFNIIQSLVQSNSISLKDVTILYYFGDKNRIEEINECVFDVYESRYIGHRILIKTLAEMSNSVYELHRNMIREIEDY